MAELKLELSNMFGKPPALYIQFLAFFEYKKAAIREEPEKQS